MSFYFHLVQRDIEIGTAVGIYLFFLFVHSFLAFGLLSRRFLFYRIFITMLVNWHLKRCSDFQCGILLCFHSALKGV